MRPRGPPSSHPPPPFEKGDNVATTRVHELAKEFGVESKWVLEIEALRDGDIDGLREPLAADVQVVGDGGGKAPALARP